MGEKINFFNPGKGESKGIRSHHLSVGTVGTVWYLVLGFLQERIPTVELSFEGLITYGGPKMGLTEMGGN